MHACRIPLGALYKQRYGQTYNETYNETCNQTYDETYNETYRQAYADLYKEPYMSSSNIPEIRLDKDVMPLSQFRANVARFITDVMATGRPLLITQRGRGIVVILDVREFEMMRQGLASPGMDAQG